MDVHHLHQFETFQSLAEFQPMEKLVERVVIHVVVRQDGIGLDRPKRVFTKMISFV